MHAHPAEYFSPLGDLLEGNFFKKDASADLIRLDCKRNRYFELFNGSALFQIGPESILDFNDAIFHVCQVGCCKFVIKHSEARRFDGLNRYLV